MSSVLLNDLKFETIYKNGEYFRSLAREHGMDVTSFNKYVEEHPNMTEHDISVYAKALTYTYKLEEKLLRRLIRIEVERTKDTSLYDLDYDDQLKEAIKIIETEDFDKLVKSTKTLKELQEQALLEDKELSKDKKEEKK